MLNSVSYKIDRLSLLCPTVYVFHDPNTAMYITFR